MKSYQESEEDELGSSATVENNIAEPMEQPQGERPLRRCSLKAGLKPSRKLIKRYSKKKTPTELDSHDNKENMEVLPQPRSSKKRPAIEMSESDVEEDVLDAILNLADATFNIEQDLEGSVDDLQTALNVEEPKQLAEAIDQENPQVDEKVGAALEKTASSTSTTEKKKKYIKKKNIWDTTKRRKPKVQDNKEDKPVRAPPAKKQKIDYSCEKCGIDVANSQILRAHLKNCNGFFLVK